MRLAPAILGAAFAALAAASALTPAAAQPRRMSNEDQPRSQAPPAVHLYSFGLGDVVFEKFGHSALCLEYAELDRRDPRQFVCFNYGVTDFADPAGLVWGFVRSRAKFWVEPVPEREIMRFYTEFEDRTVWRQRLPLSAEEARAVEHRLWTDLRPENRYYLYDHFYDNCTTRLRDILDQATAGRLRAGTEAERHALTFREFGARGLAEYRPLIMISDFITGRPLDKRPTIWEAMFHPDELRRAVETQLDAPSEVLYERQGPGFPEEPDWGRHWIVLVSLLLTAPLALVRWRGLPERAALVVACLPLFVFGIVVWAIFAVVTIDWVRWNEGLLIFVPTDLAIPFLAAGRRRRYAQVRVAMVAAASALAAVGVLRQPLWVPALVAFLPLLLIAFDLPPRRRARTAGGDTVTGSTRAAG
jgi:hypothetical protein